MILAFCYQSILRLKLFRVPRWEFHRALQHAAIFSTPLAEIQSMILHFHLQPLARWSAGPLPSGASRAFPMQGLAAQFAEGCVDHRGALGISGNYGLSRFRRIGTP